MVVAIDIKMCSCDRERCWQYSYDLRDDEDVAEYVGDDNNIAAIRGDDNNFFIFYFGVLKGFLMFTETYLISPMFPVILSVIFVVSSLDSATFAPTLRIKPTFVVLVYFLPFVEIFS